MEGWEKPTAGVAVFLLLLICGYLHELRGRLDKIIEELLYLNGERRTREFQDRVGQPSDDD